MRIAVRTLRRNRHALHATSLEKLCPRLGEHRIPIVDQVAHVAQKSLQPIQQIPGNLLHPISVREIMRRSTAANAPASTAMGPTAMASCATSGGATIAMTARIAANARGMPNGDTTA
jgi:hypothetical protein